MIRTPSFRVRAWLVAACATALPLAAQGGMGAPLSAEALRTRLFTYAADSMMGREAGSPYNIKATQYIADELKKFSGLKPGGPNGSWFQDVPLVKATFDKSSGISVGGRALKPYDEYLPRLIPEGAPRSVDGVRVIYGGTWGDSASLIPAAAGAGKAILLSVDPKGAAPTRLGVLSRYGTAAAVMLINRDYIGPNEIAAYTAAPVVLKSSEARPLVPMYTHVTNAVAERMLGAPLAGAKPGTEGATLQGAVRFIDAPQPARNVIAVLPGSDPKLAATYLAVGAHNDHVGYQVGGSVDHDSARVAYTVVRNRQNANKGVLTREMFNVTVNMDSLRKAVPVARRDSIFNGADDDGSGSMGLLEVARAFAAAKVKPKRSIIFVWHTAEELGLYGSEWFTDNPTVPRDSIVANINIDMIGRGRAGEEPMGGPEYLQVLGPKRLSTEYDELVRSVNAKSKVPFVFDYQYDANGHPEQYYCRSDHYNYGRYGIPTVFFSTGGHGDYHQVTDEPQYIDYTKLSKVSSFVFELSNTVANLDHRVVVDKPKPNPKGPCVQ